MATHYKIKGIFGLNDRVNGYTLNKINGLHLHHLRRPTRSFVYDYSVKQENEKNIK